MARFEAICSQHNRAISLLNDAIAEIEAAKVSGQNMENGLDTKRDRIKELESEVDSLTMQLNDMTSERDALLAKIEKGET